MELAGIVGAFCLASHGREKHAYESEARIIDQRWELSAT